MATAYETLRQRIIDIVVNARGADGSLGADALQKSIPLGRFRASVDRAPLTDPTYPASYFDRSIYVDWISDEDDEVVNNPLDSAHFMLAHLSVSHGVYYGTAASAFVTLASGTEVKATVALTPKERGLNDALRIKRALGCPDLLRGGTTIDPAPLSCVREGLTTLQDLGNGRLVVVTNYSLRYQSNQAVSYDP